MDTNQAAVFLLSSIGYGLGFLVWVVVVIIANNIIGKYWKTIKWTRYEYEAVYFDARDGTPLVKTPPKSAKDVK